MIVIPDPPKFGPIQLISYTSLSQKNIGVCEPAIFDTSKFSPKQLSFIRTRINAGGNEPIPYSMLSSPPLNDRHLPKFVRGD